MFAKLKNIFLAINILGCIGFIFVPNANARTQPFQFRVSFEEFTNLVYQIDCLNDEIYCQKEDFEALWKKEFLQNEADKKILASWANIRRIGVVIHEFCHFMYYNGLPEKHIAFQNMFLKSGRVTAIPAFNLLDEAFASALGDGIIRRSLAKPENWQTYLARAGSFYGKPNIDKAAKAMLPVFDEWLAKSGKMADEAFVKLYLDTMEKTFGESLTSPKFCLAQPFLFVDEKFDKSFRNHFRRSMNVASLYGETGDLSKSELKSFVENQNLNSAFIIQPKSINQLLAKKIVTSKDFKEINKIYKTEKKVLYAVKRNENVYIFIIIAENDETAKTLIQNLADSPKEFLGKFGK